MAGMKKLLSWWRSLALPSRPWGIAGYVGAADEIPDQLPAKGVILVGMEDNPTWAALDCPCRRGHQLLVNLDRSRRPVWTIDSIKPLTIRPSIADTTFDRQCHFWVRRGRIRWAYPDRTVNS